MYIQVVVPGTSSFSQAAAAALVKPVHTFFSPYSLDLNFVHIEAADRTSRLRRRLLLPPLMTKVSHA